MREREPDSLDEWFRVENSTSIYVYDCYANMLIGFSCWMFTRRPSTVDFPVVTSCPSPPS